MDKLKIILERVLQKSLFKRRMHERGRFHAALFEGPGMSLDASTLRRLMSQA